MMGIKLLGYVPKHFCVAFSGWCYRIIMAVTQVISIPIALRCLGVDNYAVFAVITGLVAWFNLADLGFGYSIQNYISTLRIEGKNTSDFLRSIVLGFLIIALVEILFFCIAAPFLQVFLLKNFVVKTSWYLLLVIGSAYVISAVCSVSYRVFFAEQKGYWGYFYQSAGWLGALLVMVVLSYLPLGNKLFLILLGWIVPQTLCALVSFIHAMPWRGIFTHYNFRLFKEIFAKAGLFNLNAIGAACVLGLDYVIMSQLLTARDITLYNIFNKVFQFIHAGYTVVLMALWPVMAEKFATHKAKEVHAVNVMLLRNIFWAMIYLIGATIFVLLVKDLLLSFFSKNLLTISYGVIVLFGVYYAVRIWVDSYATAIQSRNKIKFIAFTVPIQAVVSVSLLYYFGARYGLEGILIALILCFVVTAVWVLPCYHYLTLARENIR